MHSQTWKACERIVLVCIWQRCTTVIREESKALQANERSLYVFVVFRMCWCLLSSLFFPFCIIYLVVSVVAAAVVVDDDIDTVVSHVFCGWCCCCWRRWCYSCLSVPSSSCPSILWNQYDSSLRKAADRVRNVDLISGDVTASIGRDVATLWGDAGIQKIWSKKVIVMHRLFC